MSNVDLSQSNSLVDLAARVRAEHKAVSSALAEGLRRAIAAGELLVEAKALVPHGQWLPWLKEHCELSERTAQLYMRCAKHKLELEGAQIRNGDSDLSLTEAAAVLALSTDTKALYRFIAMVENPDEPEAVLQAATKAGLPVIHDPNYETFAGRSDVEIREWALYILFGVKGGVHPEQARSFTEWLRRVPFQNVAEWLGPEGDKFRSNCGLRPIPEESKTAWFEFLAGDSRTFAEIDAEVGALDFDFVPSQPKRRRRASRRS